MGWVLKTQQAIGDDRTICDRTQPPLDCEPVLAYIEQGWDELTRSTEDCKSLSDVKVVSHPVLYLPNGFAIPSEVTELQSSCSVDVHFLPNKIERAGDVTPEDLPAPGLLFLPHPYVVPGGRFNEMYAWDSYFIVLGLASSGFLELAKGMVDNLLFEIEYYGTVLNANRTYYLTRSQPPLLTGMIQAIYEDARSFPDRPTALKWLDNGYRLARIYHDTWVRPEHLAGDTGLSRYFDLDKGPVPELADDTKYFHDVISWLLANPERDPGYLVKAEPTGNHPAAERRCNARTGVAHERASVGEYQLAEDFYIGDRAMRESGFDTSFRFGPFSGSTHHYAPVCLNSLLHRFEQDMEAFARELGYNDDVELWKLNAKRRADAIQTYLWREEENLFTDYNFMNGSSSTYAYLSAYYPLWAGLATRDRAAAMREKLHLFEHPGGLAVSSLTSGMQWDEPFGWAPMNWIAAKGLSNYGYREEARRIAASFVETVNSSFAGDATVREKYNVERGDANVHVAAGYKDNVIGFGWTNGVYLKMLELLSTGSE